MAKNSSPPKLRHGNPPTLPARRPGASSSPLPSAQELQKYEFIQPGTVKMIFDMAEREQAERHWAQNFALETLRMDNVAERAAERRGQWMAFLLLWGCLLGAILLAFNGFTAPACILAGAPAASVLSTIITRRKK